MNNVEDVDDNLQQELKITSLSGGMEILPGMRSENLYFKPVIYPEKWDQYKGIFEIGEINSYLVAIANAGTDDPKKLYNITKSLSDNLDREEFCYEISHTLNTYDTIRYMIYARILELGFWKANFVTVGIISNYRSTLEPQASCLIYKESPVPLQMLPVACLYIELLSEIKRNTVESYLNLSTSIRDLYRDYPQMISAMVEEIKNEPLPTTKYFSWAFEKASGNLEVQKKWTLY